MATPILARSPTCLSCLRRTLSSPSSPAALPTGPTTRTTTFLYQQVRGEKSKPRRDQSVVVQLLEDIPQFGRKDAILKTERGRMRNLWFPQGRAAYVTPSAMRELGLSKGTVADRDPFFEISTARDGNGEGFVDGLLQVEEEEAAPVVRGVAPQRAAQILRSILPKELVFQKRVIQPSSPTTPTTPSQRRSPLLANSSLSTDAEAEAAAAAARLAAEQEDAARPKHIFGSVTTADVAEAIRALCAAASSGSERSAEGGATTIEEEAALIRVEARDISFVLSDADNEAAGGGASDRVRATGRWPVLISVRDDAVQPVRRTVVVEAAAEV